MNDIKKLKKIIKCLVFLSLISSKTPPKELISVSRTQYGLNTDLFKLINLYRL